MTLTAAHCDRSGKLRYATRTGAFAVGKRMTKRRPKNGIKVPPCEVYRCQFCHAFHVGHLEVTKGKR